MLNEGEIFVALTSSSAVVRTEAGLNGFKMPQGRRNSKHGLLFGEVCL